MRLCRLHNKLPLLVALLLVLLAADAGMAKHRHPQKNGNANARGNNNVGINDNQKQRMIEEGQGHQIAPQFGQQGREYRFRLDSQTASGYAPWISTQRAMSRFQALISVRFVSTKEAEMRVTECLAGQLNGKPVIDAWDPARIQPVEAFETNAKFQHEQLERPVRFGYEQGAIDKIRFHPEEPAWSKNVKKAVLNMLQLQLAKSVVEQKRDAAEKRIERELRQQTGTIGGKPQHQEEENTRQRAFNQLQRSFSLSETTIEGDCQCQYSMVPVDADLVNVTKTVDFDRCRVLADVAFGMQADEEGKLRGGQKQAWGQQQRPHDRLAHMAEREEEMDSVEQRNRSGSPMIAKQTLDRSTTIRYVLTNHQQQSSANSNNDKQEDRPGLDAYGIQHVELLSQYVLKGSQAESSQAMQVVATAKLHFLGSTRRESAKPGNDGIFDTVDESLVYNAEMEAQEKCFYMFGDDRSDQASQCPKPKSSAMANNGKAVMTPYPFNYPSSESKVGQAVEMLKQMAMQQQQQGNVQQQEQAQNGAMDAAERLEELVQILRFCTEAELKKIQDTINSQQTDQIGAIPARAAQFYADALAASGTRNTLKLLLQRIETGTEFSDLRAAQLLKTFSRGSGLPAPSDKIADLVLALCKSSRVQKSGILKQACWLSFGAIIGELNQQQRIVRHSPVRTPTSDIESCPGHKMELYTKALVEQFKNAHSDDFLDEIVALKAIGNAALDAVPQELVECIRTDNAQQQQEVGSKCHEKVVRQNAMEALRRIPSQKVQQLLMPVYLNQEEKPMTRIIALSVLMQSQLVPSAPVLDQIAFQMAREKCPQVLAYTQTTLQAMAQSPAKKHQKIAQHVKTQLQMAGVDEQELEEKCRGAASKFRRSTAFYNQKEETGAFIEIAKVFNGKSASLPTHMTWSLSSLLNGQLNEEKLKLTLCQGNLERFFQQSLDSIDREEGQEGTEENNSNEEQEKSSYLSSAKDQLQSIWQRIRGVSRSEQQQKEEERKKQPFVVVSLRVNNVDTFAVPITAESLKQQGSPLAALKQVLLTAGIGTEAEYANGAEKPAMDLNGILFWQGRSARVPTSTGQQLNIQQKSTLFGQIRADARKLGRTQFSLEFRPALTYASVQKMKVWASPVHASGVKRVVAVQATVPLGAQLTIQPQQQQIKLDFRVPQAKTRLFAFHTLPSTFVSDNAFNSGNSNNAASSPYHFGERVKSIENRQLKGHKFGVDKIAYQSVGLPIHVQGQLHRPRSMNELKEWAKVILASENHYHVDFEPTSGHGQSSPRQVALSLNWKFFDLHANTPGQSLRPELKQFMQKFAEKAQPEFEETFNMDLGAEEQDKQRQQIESRVEHMTQVLKKYGQQKAYKHSIKCTLETVGGEQNKRAELALDTVCNAMHSACDTRASVKCSRAGPNEPALWQADAQIQTILPWTYIDMDHMTVLGQSQPQKTEQNQQRDNDHVQHIKLFIQKMVLEWSAGEQAEKQHIKLSIKGETSEEVLRMFRDYMYAKLEQQEQQEIGTGLQSASAHSKLARLPRNAGRPFINEWKFAAEYKLHAPTLNFFYQYFSDVKAKHPLSAHTRYFPTCDAFANGNQQNQQQQKQDEGQLRIDYSIDPVTHKHANISVQTECQQVEFRQIELPRPVRPLPFIVRFTRSSGRASHSLKQMLQQSVGHPVRARAECRVDTRREQLQTFDGVQTAAPISKCWTLLAKTCHQQKADDSEAPPAFAVLIKSIAGSQQKKLKVVSPEMGVLLIEPKQQIQGEEGDEDNNKLQVRITGQKQPINSEMPQSQIPEGIEFAQPTGTVGGKETVIVESELGHFQVRFNGQTVRIRLHGMDYQNTQCGLCGNWDDEAGNDMKALPSGGAAQSVQQYQRAYAIEQGEDDNEDGGISGCTSQVLDQFYAHNAEKFNQQGGQGLQKAIGGNNNDNDEAQQQQSQQVHEAEEDADDEEDGSVEIAPQQRTALIEYAHQLCFSLRPVKQCPVGSFATGGSHQQDDVKTELKQQKVAFTCFDRSSLEAKRLRQQARRGQTIQLADYPASFQEVVVVPEKCVKY